MIFNTCPGRLPPPQDRNSLIAWKQASPVKSAFIIHGTGGYPEENWFPWLKEKLEGEGYKVYVPQFPTPENQDPEHWFAVFREYGGFVNGDTIIVAHSGGCAFLLRLLEKAKERINGAVFVAPPLGIMPIAHYKADKPFLNEPFNWGKIRSGAKHFLVFHSEDDPLVCIGNGEKLAGELGVNLVRLSDAGHFNAQAGYTAFELLLEKIRPIL